MSESKRRTPRLVAEKRASSAKRTKKSAANRKAGAKRKPVTTRKPRAARKSTRRRPPSGRSGGLRGALRAALRWVFGLVWAVTWRAGLVVSIIVGLAVAYQYVNLPDARDLLDGRARGSVTMLDRNGEVFAWRGDQFGGAITTDTVSPHLKNAIVATEDKRFYHHFGVDPIGIAGAIRINLSEGRGPLQGNGGSTITQQTAKLLCLGRPYDPKQWKSEAEYEADCRQTTLWRKIKEAVFAMAMEAKYSKDEILTIYMNRAFLGAGTRGFEAAAQRYFGKSAAEVNPAEAAMLAGLLKAPTRYAPTNNLARAQGRANLIIGLMEEQGYLTPQQAALARAHPAELSEAARARAGGYFADWLMGEIPSYFGDNTTEDVVIRTTLDPRIQASAEEALQFVFQERVREGSKAQAAIVVMSADGAVRAMVGGRKTRVSGVFNRATQARRQTGSAFKPFVYATALDLGQPPYGSPLDTVLDEPFCENIPGSGRWCPKNYSGKYYGEVTLTRALRDSLNVPAVKVAEAVGLENVRKVANGFGLSGDLAEGPALALGVSEATLIEMTAAYAGILNGGQAVKPYGLVELRLRGDDAPLMGAGGGIRERVIRESAARQLIWMMEKVVSQGSGRRAALPDRQAAGKTGTTQAARDAWFIGFTADYVVGVWMGYDDNTPLSGVTGGGLPAEIWREAMQRINEGLPPRPLPMDPPSPPTRPRGNDPIGGLGRAVDQLLQDIFGGGGGRPAPTVNR
ncbi:transglycosylase domain-containing protein [Jhaorihella thermophila]|uniref:peptidoglycan glycosyltransferase n=1 Tax=Jhaorihella thermophila TaxID=488547 RepID=A0A1H5YB94_9RHOB|nr:PBP1A family penicillin-binding protein [Jhaorihella thermophila]SEG20736.1 penicillin-binding protein, 1A family [Jhaorihella thermophila]